MVNLDRADVLTREHSAFGSFDELVYRTFEHYRPSLNVSNKEYGEDLKELADYYDEAQEARGDTRRAFRY